MGCCRQNSHASNSFVLRSQSDVSCRVWRIAARKKAWTGGPAPVRTMVRLKPSTSHMELYKALIPHIGVFFVDPILLNHHAQPVNRLLP
jgi:hypothetical protein